MSPSSIRLLVAALCLIVGNADAQRAGRTPDVIRDTTLENGLTIIAARVPSAPVARAVLAFRAGAFTQANENEAGVPHLIEHMLFKSFQRNGGRTFGSVAAADLEASYNGSTGDEMVNYYLYMPAKFAPKSMKVLSDLVRAPRFDARDMVTEVDVVRNEIERHVADPKYQLEFMMNQELWGPDWTRKNPGGNVFALRNSSPASLDALHKRYYTPNNAVVVVSGDIVIDEIFAAARVAFKDWKKGAATATQPITMTPLKANKAIEVSGGVSDITIRVAWHGPSAGADPTGAMSAALLTSMLNNRNSPLQRNLVDEGHFESVSASYDFLNYVGPIVLTARTTGDKLQAASEALQKEVARLADPQAFTETDLRLAKKAWQVDAALEWERGSAIAMYVADHWTIAGFPSYVKYPTEIAARTVADVRKCVETYITGKPRVTGLLLSAETKLARGLQVQRVLGAWGAK
jgi:zinc protease